jgi:quercetin dioxygenase-like cupin family protein
MIVEEPTTPIITRLPDIAAIECPCGDARRGLIDDTNPLCSIHMVEVSVNARSHFHEGHTEVYYVLEGEGEIELDESRTNISPGTAILIPPGVRHRAVVKEGTSMRILNFVVPPFDPDDEIED